MFFNPWRYDPGLGRGREGVERMERGREGKILREERKRGREEERKEVEV